MKTSLNILSFMVAAGFGYFLSTLGLDVLQGKFWIGLALFFGYELLGKAGISHEG